jgi:HAD superfamily, subfamily IIIB (Acid phosphatase)
MDDDRILLNGDDDDDTINDLEDRQVALGGSVPATSGRVQFARRALFLFLLLTILLFCAFILMRMPPEQDDRPTPHSNSDSDPPLVNLDIAKSQVKNYHQSGLYDAQVSQACADFERDVLVALSRLDAERRHRAAVVFDIDDTLLANYVEMIDADFAYVPKQFNEWLHNASAPAIAQTKGVYDSMRQRDVATLLLTGRSDAVRDATALNLQRVGIERYETLICRNADELHLSAADYKAARRAQLAQHYEIVGCIGDQRSDCTQGHAGVIAKLPNYCYFVQ